MNCARWAAREGNSRVAAVAWSSSIASRACCIRRRPSKEKGFVTIPTVRQSAAFASSATTGAAPEPVPPPIPAVTNTMSTPDTSVSMSPAASIADARPTEGTPPAPSPRAALRPSWIVVSASDADSACTSVFAATYSRKVLRSTPGPSSTMRLRVLPPPPPTPITLIEHGESPGACGARRSSGRRRRWPPAAGSDLVLHLRHGGAAHRPRRPRVRHEGGAVGAAQSHGERQDAFHRRCVGGTRDAT